jgi:hypothetical protein
MTDEDCPAAVPLQTEIIKNLASVVTVPGSVFELVPFVANNFAAGKASRWNNHGVSHLGDGGL